jgi:HTH-type transcriptional regulator/antitoxin HigA
MEPKPIKTEADHARALAHIESLFGAKPGTPEDDALDLWVTLIELYEEQAFPIPAPDPLTAIRFRIEQQGLKARDLVPNIGRPSTVSEVLATKLDAREAAARLPEEAPRDTTEDDANRGDDAEAADEESKRE